MFHLDILTNIMVRTAHEIDKLLKKTGQFQSYPFTGGHFGEHMMTQEWIYALPRSLTVSKALPDHDKDGVPCKKQGQAYA